MGESEALYAVLDVPHPFFNGVCYEKQLEVLVGDGLDLLHLFNMFYQLLVEGFGKNDDGKLFDFFGLDRS